MLHSLLVATLIASPTVAPERAYYLSTADTGELAQICGTASPEALTADFCTGYSTATFDALTLAGAICPGPEATTLQLVGVVRDYLAGHKEMWDRAPSFVLTRAFKDASPAGSAKALIRGDSIRHDRVSRPTGVVPGRRKRAVGTAFRRWGSRLAGLLPERRVS